jgi:hypothetical protein
MSDPPERIAAESHREAAERYATRVARRTFGGRVTVSVRSDGEGEDGARWWFAELYRSRHDGRVPLSDMGFTTVALNPAP